MLQPYVFLVFPQVFLVFPVFPIFSMRNPPPVLPEPDFSYFLELGQCFSLMFFLFFVEFFLFFLFLLFFL